MVKCYYYNRLYNENVNVACTLPLAGREIIMGTLVLPVILLPLLT